MLFVPLLGGGFGDFLVGLGILFTLPEAEKQRDKGRRTGTLCLCMHKGLKPSPALCIPPQAQFVLSALSQHLQAGLSSLTVPFHKHTSARASPVAGSCASPGLCPTMPC